MHDPRRVALPFIVSIVSACNLFSATPGETGDVSVDAAVRDDAPSTLDLGGMSDTGRDVSIRDMSATPDAAPADMTKNVDASADAADACEGEAETSICTRLGVECGTVAHVDNCGTERLVSCAPCVAEEVCRQNLCVCTPESDAAICARLALACGSAQAVDNCGAARTVQCAPCTAPATCQQNACVCIPESDLEFCTRLTKDCDAVSAPDNCGMARAVSCGTCTLPAVCGGGGTPNVCACAAQSDAQFCSANGATCGSLTAVDVCGQSRTVSCGACTSPESCGGGGMANTCGCSPETDSELCAANGAECGPLTVTDRCGASRTVNDCGACAGACQPDGTCGVTFSSVVGGALRHNAAPVVDVITVTGCPTVAGVSVDVNITHTYRGDIRLDLLSPGGVARRLKTESTMVGGANLIGNYPATLTPVEPLDALIGETANGDWTITAQDMYQQDQGTFEDWSLHLVCN